MSTLALADTLDQDYGRLLERANEKVSCPTRRAELEPRSETSRRYGQTSRNCQFAGLNNLNILPVPRRVGRKIEDPSGGLNAGQVAP